MGFFTFLFVLVCMSPLLIYFYVIKHPRQKQEQGLIYNYQDFKAVNNRVVGDKRYFKLFNDGIKMVYNDETIFIGKDDIAKPDKFHLSYEFSMDKAKQGYFAGYIITIIYNGKYFILNTAADLDHMKSLEDWIQNIRNSNPEGNKLYDDFKNSINVFKSTGTYKSFPDLAEYFQKHEFYNEKEIFVIHKDNETKDLNIIEKSYDKLFNLEIPYEDIKYYHLEGEVDNQIKVGGGQIKGGGYSVGKAAVGYALGGTAGAIIAGANRIESTPISIESKKIDTRKTCLHYDIAGMDMEIILPKEAYIFLKYIYPEKNI